ncbi:hypothetical protein FOL47_003921 [Perkinsus chesapeaki]|uniref:Uncharacterized protein n=1 Tax=Perkinsus chesapeaki TaxID=330153 RepID=A0A7J6M591_PERCH|nr:hypothetical protein FOL47_003921 [Perkinsus chesapeaki]
MYQNSTRQRSSGRESQHILLGGLDPSVYDESNLGKDGLSRSKALRLLVPLAFYGIGLYILFNILLMIMMPYIIERCVSQWKMEIVELDLGPRPPWWDGPPLYVRGIPPGSRNANVSLSLSVKNNPWWLAVEVYEVSLLVWNTSSSIDFYRNIPSFAGDADFTLTSRVHLADVMPYLCLQYSSNDQPALLSLLVSTRFRTLGLSSSEFKLRTSLLYNGTKRRTASEPHISREGIRILKAWRKYRLKYINISTEYQRLGKVYMSKAEEREGGITIGSLHFDE